MFTEASYNAFFRQAAHDHVNIGHDDTAEDQDAAKGACRFFIGLDNAIEGVRNLDSNEEKCILAALKYEAKGYDNGAGDYRAVYTGGFMVLAPADHGNAVSEEAAEVLAEETAWDIVNLIVTGMVDDQGMRCESPFGEVSLNDFRITHVGPMLEKGFGWIVDFDFTIDRKWLMGRERLNTQFNH